MQAICILMGIPEADRHQLFAWIEHTFDFKGGREAFETTDEVARAAAAMFEYGTALIAEKRAHPADDMLSIVCHAAARRRGPARAHRPGAAVLLLVAVGGRRRHHAQRDRGRGRRARRVPRSVARAARRRRGERDRGRGDRALDAPGRVQPPHRDARPRARAARPIARRRQGRVLGSVREPRRGRVRRPVPLRPRAATRIRISASATACTTASARTWPGSRSASCSTSSRARVGDDRAHRPGRVDAQQQAHRHPAPAGPAAPARVRSGCGADRRRGSGCRASSPVVVAGGSFAAGVAARTNGVGSVSERDHAFVDVVHPLAVERARRPRAPEVPPRLHLAPEAERERARQQDLVLVRRRRGTFGST